MQLLRLDQPMEREQQQSLQRVCGLAFEIWMDSLEPTVTHRRMDRFRLLSLLMLLLRFLADS